MFHHQIAPLPSAAPPSAAFTLIGAFTAAGRTIPHRQYLTSEYVVTEFEGAVVLFAPSLGGRFTVDRPNRLLRRIDYATRSAQLEHLRGVIGEVVAEDSDHPCEIEGLTCRLRSVRNENGKIDIFAEAWCTRVKGAELTALGRERAFDVGFHPFSLPLEDDEVVVRSVMRTVANGTEQRQTYRLRSISPLIEEQWLLEEVLAYSQAHS